MADLSKGARRCPACGTQVSAPFFSLEGVPTHVAILWGTREEARSCPRGDLRLMHCPACDLVFNMAFDPALAEYDASYDNALHFSSVFQEYEADVATRLVDRYGVRGGEVVEVGCGNGHFLGLLCELGGNRGLGFDPSFDRATADPRLSGRAEVVREPFSPDHVRGRPDLVVCRQVLEHLPDPAGLLADLRAGLGEGADTVVFLEVPNSLLPFRHLLLSVLIYEHYTYFIPSSLRRIAESAGFEVIDLYEAYHGQFLGLELRPARPRPPAGQAGNERFAADIRAFPGRAREQADGWRAIVEDLRASGRAGVAWGAGARAVGLFNMLGVDGDIERIVDLNPRKQGAHLPGTGQRIVPPEDLVSNPADRVLVMNPVYLKEITDMVRDMGVRAEVVPV